MSRRTGMKVRLKVVALTARVLRVTMCAAGFGMDTDRGFMVVEIASDNVYFQTISRTGQTIDSGTVAQ